MSVTLAVTSKNWRYRLPLTFFGLSDRHIQKVYEQFFYLKYYGGWSFIEAYNLPVLMRRWFLQRLADQKKEEAEQIQDAQRKAKSSRR